MAVALTATKRSTDPRTSSAEFSCRQGFGSQAVLLSIDYGSFNELTDGSRKEETKTDELASCSSPPALLQQDSATVRVLL